MKKIFLLLAILVTAFANAQTYTGTTKAGKYEMYTPRVSQNKSDSLVVWNGQTKELKYLKGSDFINQNTPFIPLAGTDSISPVFGPIKNISSYDIYDTDNNKLASLANDGGGDAFLQIGNSLLSSVQLSTLGINLKKNNTGVPAVNFNSSDITQSYNLKVPNKASGTDYTIATIEDVSAATGNFVPYTGVTNIKPITGNLILKNSNGTNINLLQNASGIGSVEVFDNTDSNVISSALSPQGVTFKQFGEQEYSILRDESALRVDGSTSMFFEGLKADIDLSSRTPSNKFIYAQRSYVDNAISTNTPVGVEGSIPVWQSGVLSTIPSELSYDTTNKRFSFGTQAALNPDANSNFKYKLGNGPTTGFDFYSTFRVSENRTTANNFNGFEANIYTTLSGNSTARARAGKFVSNIILNNFNSSNSGGGGEGLEAVTRVTGLGTLNVAVGAYTRILIDDNNANVNTAVNFIAPTNSATAAHPFAYSAGVILSEQAATNTTNAANLVIGTPMADVGDMLTNARWTGNYSIWNEGVNKNYFKSFLGINNIAPTEMLDVVGNIKATGTVNAGGLTIPTGTFSVTGGSASNVIRGDGSLATISNTVQNQVISGYVTGSNTPVTATNTVRTAIQDLQAQITALTPLTATATLDFPSTLTATSSDLTINVTNAVVGKPVYLGPNVAAVVANTSYTAFVSAAGIVTVRLNNYSGAAVNPASSTFTVNVTK